MMVVLATMQTMSVGVAAAVVVDAVVDVVVVIVEKMVLRVASRTLLVSSSREPPTRAKGSN